MNVKDGNWLLFIVKWGRIALYLGMLFLVHLLISDIVMIIIFFGILLHELWDIQMSIIALEDKVYKEKGDIDIGRLIKERKNPIKH